MQFALQTAKERFEEEADNIQTKHEENHAGYGGHNDHKFTPKALMLLGLLWWLLFLIAGFLALRSWKRWRCNRRFVSHLPSLQHIP